MLEAVISKFTLQGFLQDLSKQKFKSGLLFGFSTLKCILKSQKSNIHPKITG